MPDVPSTHRDRMTGRVLRCAVLTCSDTRTTDTDVSGRLIIDRLESAGHVVEHYRIVREEDGAVTAAIAAAMKRAEVVLLNGGTGIGRRDGSVEAVEDRVDRIIPGFGELFRMLSFEEIGASAMLSRAVAGVADGRVLIAMPGSPAAVRLAMDRLILPELLHLVGELDR